MKSVRVRRHVQRRETRVPSTPPHYLRMFADEAQDIIGRQGYVVGYPTESFARRIRAELAKRGIMTKVYLDYGSPIAEPRTSFEARWLEELGLKPGRHYALWGLRKMRPQPKR